uniref:Putative rna polymerase ii elongation factor n=1 Tax=Triatoma infestans TaxID=30076 RepID=A0A023F1T6_TRIIF
MAALVAGVQYGLTSQGHFNENKSLIFVKLTDSAFRAVEEYLKNRNKCNQTPTIQFLGNEGHLSLPCGPSARGRAGFKFSLSSNADIEGPQGSFECIQHTGQRCLESVGSLPCKMRVQANEDVYETTKNRMQAAEKQQKENCTREIELDKTGLGRRVKLRSKMVNGISRKPITPVVPVQPPTHAPQHTTTSHTKPQGNNHAQKPGNPEIMKRPIRDRIIHLLALRPYRKPELLMALSREGLREKDRNKLMNTVMTVATVNKDNTFSLMRHVWNDVQEDWPFYSEQDKNMLKRRKPENLTPPGSSDSASPNSVHPGSPPSASEPLSAKRPGYYDGADGLPTKRQRISHYRKPTPPQQTSYLTPPSSESTPPPTRDTQIHPSPPTPPMETSPPPPPQPAKYPPDYPKYLIDYTTIKDVDQRRKYKEDFNANYNEYRQLHSVVEKVSRRFSQLDERLKREERGSEGWQRIKDQILKEYSENKKNTKHQDAKRRFQYLHDKLSHIKRLVIEYDSKNS